MLWPDTVDRREDGALCIGNIAAPKLAAAFGTPLYVYDEATLRTRARSILSTFRASYPNTRVVYASKALLSLSILRILHQEGLELDVVSGGELFAGLRAGVPANQITFHGNNKSEQELREALAAGVGRIVIDNHFELALIAQLTAHLGTRVPVLLRLNPGVDVHTHAKIKTGVTDSKFGFPLWNGDAAKAVARTKAIPGIDLVGYHAHLGSQLFDAETMGVAVNAMIEFAAAMDNDHGVALREFSPGGGFGIAYTNNQKEANINEWAATVSDALIASCEQHRLSLPELAVEPGRWIVGPAAIALYRVGARKEIPGVRTYVSVDGGMADNIRPSLYGAKYTAALANRAASGLRETVTIAGKYCESGDILIEQIDLPSLESGDLLAIPGAGAYCLAMASNYNHAPRPAVVLVNDGLARLIRRRETYADLISTEVDA